MKHRQFRPSLRTSRDWLYSNSICIVPIAGYSCIPSSRSYEKPYKWRFAHFQGLNSVIALEQSDYDPQMGVQLVLVLQPLPRKPRRSAITSKW